MHPQLAFLFRRDDFNRPDVSPASFLVPQGWFQPAGCISVYLFGSVEMISTGQMHPQLAFLFRRDDFNQPDASLSSSFVPQGWFQPARCIPVWPFCSTEMISTGQMHPKLAFFFHRDYFNRPAGCDGRRERDSLNRKPHKTRIQKSKFLLRSRKKYSPCKIPVKEQEKLFSLQNGY